MLPVPGVLEYAGFEEVASEVTSGLTESVLAYQRDSLGAFIRVYTFSLHGTMVQQVLMGYDSADRLSARVVQWFILYL